MPNLSSLQSTALTAGILDAGQSMKGTRWYTHVTHECEQARISQSARRGGKAGGTHLLELPLKARKRLVQAVLVMLNYFKLRLSDVQRLHSTYRRQTHALKPALS